MPPSRRASQEQMNEKERTQLARFEKIALRENKENNFATPLM
jgi:hypothetical protein